MEKGKLRMKSAWRIELFCDPRSSILDSLLYLCATSTGTTNSLRMKPVGPLSMERTCNQSPCLPSTVTRVPMVKVSSEAAEKFGSLRSEVAYLI